MIKAPNRLNQIFDNVIAKVISTGIVALVTALITYCVSKQFSFTTLEICLLVILSVLFIIIVSYVIYRRKNRKLPDYPPIDCAFHMICEERVHKWINKDDYVHIRRYRIKALKDNLKEYVDKFQWTGSEYKLSGGEGEYTVIEDKKSKNVFTMYRFVFNTPLKKGNTIDLEAIWDAKGPAKPFFSTDIEEPTDELVMEVELFPESGIKKVYCRVDNNIGTIGPPIETKKEKLNSEGKYRWIVSNPKILHHYEINWDVKQ